MAGFSYKNNPFTPEQYQAQLDVCSKMFLRWRVKLEFYKKKPIEQAFTLWWNLRGPTGFKTTEDSFRFRKELLANVLSYIQESINENSKLENPDKS